MLKIAKAFHFGSGVSASLSSHQRNFQAWARFSQRSLGEDARGILDVQTGHEHAAVVHLLWPGSTGSALATSALAPVWFGGHDGDMGDTRILDPKDTRTPGFVFMSRGVEEDG